VVQKISGDIGLAQRPEKTREQGSLLLEEKGQEEGLFQKFNFFVKVNGKIA